MRFFSIDVFITTIAGLVKHIVLALNDYRRYAADVIKMLPTKRHLVKVIDSQGKIAMISVSEPTFRQIGEMIRGPVEMRMWFE